MCGITGLLHLDGSPLAPSVIQAMTDAIAHRGPDGEGSLLRQSIALGHRRLAIIDPRGGHQPLCNEDEQIWITYNGELYNFQELRSQLISLGHTFRTNSDTETVVHAYEAWGEACVERFRGMFAFGIADFRHNKLFIARDHLGIKPLYYLHQPGCFAFASEIQALLQIPGWDHSLDLQAIDDYLALRYIPAPRSAYRHIRKLPPAHRLSISFDGRLSGPQAYWQLEFAPDEATSPADWIEAIDQRLAESVKAHLISDVPFGAFLSGGVDSSAVVAYMAQSLNQPVKTFSIGFEDQKYDELAYAAQVAKRWGTEHHVEVVRPDTLAILPEMVRHYGEPFGDNSAIPTYYVCRMARQFVPMVLSGDGGDEFFLGYNSYRRLMGWLEHDDVHKKPRWKQSLYPLASKLMPQRYPDPKQRRADLDLWLSFNQYLRPGQRQALWRADYAAAYQPQPEAFQAPYAQARNYSPAKMAQYLDIKTYLPYDILAKVDVASMMHGLEVRTPLVDIRVLELAARIPARYNLARLGPNEWDGKQLFKKALQRYYPAEFFQRPKRGFSVPVKDWLAPDGNLQPIIERLTSASACLPNYFDPAMVRMFGTHKSYNELWLLLVLEEWLGQNR